jgi:hypothetical protein
MQIRCSGVFKRMTGEDVIRLSISAPVTVSQLTTLVVNRFFPENSSNFCTDVVCYATYLKFIRGERLLQESDLVHDNDSLEMFIPAVGG